MLEMVIFAVLLGDPKPIAKSGEPVYAVTRGVTPPQVEGSAEPDTAAAAIAASPQKKVRITNSTAVLLVIIHSNGISEVKGVVQSSGHKDLDQKAFDAVSKWRWRPATYKGQPVAVQLNVEVNFHSYPQ